MIQPIHFYLLGAFIVAMIIANIVLPNILLISHKKRLFDMPDERKVHHAPIPRLGGLAFFPVMLITMGGLVLVHHLMGLNSGAMQGEAPYEYLALLVGSMMLFLVGLADDLIGVGYKKKFIVQILRQACSWLRAYGSSRSTDSSGCIRFHHGSVCRLPCSSWCNNVFGNEMRGRKLFMGDVYPDQRGADRGYQHHVYPGHRHRCMDCVPPYPGCHPAHQEGETGYLIL